MTSRQKVIDAVKDQIARDTAEIEKLKRNLTDDPFCALEWAGAAAQAAARLKVWTNVEFILESRPEVTLLQISTHINGVAQQCARQIARSTSPHSNIMEDELRVARFECVERLEYFMRQHPDH